MCAANSKREPLSLPTYHRREEGHAWSMIHLKQQPTVKKEMQKHLAPPPAAIGDSAAHDGIRASER